MPKQNSNERRAKGAKRDATRATKTPSANDETTSGDAAPATPEANTREPGAPGAATVEPAVTVAPARGDWPLAQIEKRALSSLRGYERNSRTHTQEQIDQIAASISEWGWTMPILVDETGMIIAGHARAAAAPKAGYSDVPVIVARGWSEAQKRAYVIADNRLALSSSWDTKLLAVEIGALKAEGFNLGLMGFDQLELKTMLKFGTPHVGDENEVVPPPEVPVSQRGDIWELGEHRLMCGSSTSPEDVMTLMDGELASMLATDPPYLVDYQGGNHPQSWMNKKEVKDKHWDDYIDPKDAVKFFSDWMRAALMHCIERVPIYQWHATKRQVDVEAGWKSNGLLVHQTIVWVKARAVLTRCHFMWQHEPCFYGWREGQQPEKGRKPPANTPTVWQINQIGESDGIHPTQKPLAIFEGPIEWHTKPGEIVLEPFSGSGTQLIAAEKLSRRCRAMELAPAFVDVDVIRWQNYTGKVARLRGDGRSFKEIAAVRGVDTAAAEAKQAGAVTKAQAKAAKAAKAKAKEEEPQAAGASASEQ